MEPALQPETSLLLTLTLPDTGCVESFFLLRRKAVPFLCLSNEANLKSKTVNSPMKDYKAVTELGPSLLLPLVPANGSGLCRWRLPLSSEQLRGESYGDLAGRKEAGRRGYLAMQVQLRVDAYYLLETLLRHQPFAGKGKRTVGKSLFNPWSLQ